MGEFHGFRGFMFCPFFCAERHRNLRDSLLSHYAAGNGGRGRPWADRDGRPRVPGSRSDWIFSRNVVITVLTVISSSCDQVTDADGTESAGSEEYAGPFGNSAGGHLFRAIRPGDPAWRFAAHLPGPALRAVHEFPAGNTRGRKATRGDGRGTVHGEEMPRSFGGKKDGIWRVRPAGPPGRLVAGWVSFSQRRPALGWRDHLTTDSGALWLGPARFTGERGRRVGLQRAEPKAATFLLLRASVCRRNRF
jgi:hypothetical protein